MNPIYLTDSQQAEYDEMLQKKKIKAEKKEIARVKSCVKTAEYQRVHREWTNNYQKIAIIPMMRIGKIKAYKPHTHGI